MSEKIVKYLISVTVLNSSGDNASLKLRPYMNMTFRPNGSSHPSYSLTPPFWYTVIAIRMCVKKKCSWISKLRSSRVWALARHITTLPTDLCSLEFTCILKFGIGFPFTIAELPKLSFSQAYPRLIGLRDQTWSCQWSHSLTLQLACSAPVVFKSAELGFCYFPMLVLMVTVVDTAKFYSPFSSYNYKILPWFIISALLLLLASTFTWERPYPHTS